MKEQKYCTFCAKKLTFKTLLDGSREKYCDECDYVFFNTPSPAVIVMVTNSNKVLLARGVDWKHPYWGLVAGHIEIGDTAEETAIREVREEVGVEVANLELVGTYAPKHSDLLMIAFKSETEDTSIKKSQELNDAKWFDLSLPLPMRPESTAAHVVKHVFPKIKYMKLKQLGK